MLRKLSSEEAAELVGKINAQYESNLDASGIFLSKDEKREAKKIFFYSGDHIPNVPAEWTGLHFCTVKDGVVIPSIEGAQAYGRTAKRAIVQNHRPPARRDARVRIRAEKPVNRMISGTTNPQRASTIQSLFPLR